MIFETLCESAERGELLLEDGGLLHYHARRDGQVTIREIIVLPECRRYGRGRRLLRRLLRRNPEATRVLARCPTDLPANGWYERMGFRLNGTEEAKSGRVINVWVLDGNALNPDLPIFYAGRG